jgi:hypothetical protein
MHFLLDDLRIVSVYSQTPVGHVANAEFHFANGVYSMNFRFFVRGLLVVLFSQPIIPLVAQCTDTNKSTQGFSFVRRNLMDFGRYSHRGRIGTSKGPVSL